MLTYSYSELLWSVGSRIREARKARGLTQEQLAELTGLDRVAVGYLEQGRRAPRLKTLHILAEKLDVDVSYFITIDDGSINIKSMTYPSRHPMATITRTTPRTAY